VNKCSSVRFVAPALGEGIIDMTDGYSTTEAENEEESDRDRPNVPTDPRQCQHCYQVYEVLVLHCPECGSDNTQFVDEDTLEETDGFGNDPAKKYHSCHKIPNPDGGICRNEPVRTITVRYEGSKNTTEMEFYPCEDHVDEVRESGGVIEDRPYDKSTDGFEA